VRVALRALRGLAARLRDTLFRSEAERRMDEEFRFHIEMETEKNIRKGHDPVEARRRALVAFGGTERYREEARERRRLPLVEDVWRDIRHAGRALRRTPGVTLVAVPTLALAIGATTVLFSFADALLLRPLPVRDPGRLVGIYHVSSKDPRDPGSFSYPDFLDIRDAERSAGLRQVAVYAGMEVQLGDAPGVVQVEGAIVSGSYFSVLGVRPLLGRTFLPEEDRTPGAHPVVILSEALWASRFSADPSLVGGQITLDGRPFTVVGVVPRSTPSPDIHADPQLWVPVMMHEVVLPYLRAEGLDLLGSRSTQWFGVIGRLGPGMTFGRVRSALDVLSRREAEEYPQIDGAWSIAMAPLGGTRTGAPGTSNLPRLTALMAVVVGMVLLLACANVANLLLARAVVRRHEMAVRAALGAGRARLARQTLTEALLLAAVGGAGGILLAAWGTSVLPSLGLASGLPGLHVGLDGRVLGVALLTTFAVGLACGVVPSLRASTADAARGGTGSPPTWSGGRARFPLHRSLVAFQVAVSLVLLIGAGLALRTLWNLYAIPLGFDTTNLRVAEVHPTSFVDPGFPEFDSPSAPSAGEWSRVVESVRTLPGVRGAALASIAPFSSRSMANDFFREGEGGSRERFNVAMNVVSGGYFGTMGIGLVAGRTFTAADVPGGLLVAVVNEALASRIWPGGSAVGKRIWMRDFHSPDGPGIPIEVVGVVSNGRYYRTWRNAGERPFAFLPLSQHPERTMLLHVRGAASGIPTAAELRRAVTSADPTLTIVSMASVTRARAQAVTLQRTSAKLLTLFGMLAGLIAVIGIYGVVSFTVSRRSREIGVRMALGSRPRDVRQRVVAGSALPILVGAAVGWLVALALSMHLSSLLYGVSPRDPTTFAVVGAALVAVGLLASLVPARRASRVDPLTVLRAE